MSERLMHNLNVERRDNGKCLERRNAPYNVLNVLIGILNYNMHIV